MPYDWNNPYNSPVPYDVGNPQPVTLSGIPTSEALGQDTVQATGPASVTLSGIPSAQAFGIGQVSAPASISMIGLGSSEAFGSARLDAPAFLTMTGIPSTEAFGTINAIMALNLLPTMAARVL